MARRSITFPSQCRELTLVRQDDPVWAGAHRSLAVATLKGVELALQAFFRRVKAGVNGGGKAGHVGGSSPWLRLDEVIALFSVPGVEPADCGAWTCPQAVGARPEPPAAGSEWTG